MAQEFFSVATLSLPIILYQPLNIRDFIEYGIANLIIWQLATITQIFYKIFAYTTKVDREGFGCKELLVLHFQRDNFLYHVDAHTRL